MDHLKGTENDPESWFLFKFIVYVHPELWGKTSDFDEHIFQPGWFNHQLVQFKPLHLFGNIGECFRKELRMIPSVQLI